MKRIHLFALLFAAAVLAGCHHSRQAATPPPSGEMPLPTHAQPKLPTMKIYFGVLQEHHFRPVERLEAEQALTPREQQIGMMFRTNIQDSDSMLFVFPGPFQASFWMKNCPESISAAYIDPAGVIEEIHHLEKEDTNSVVAASANIQYVLETSAGWFQRHHVTIGMVIRTDKGSLQQTYFPDQQ